MRQRFDEFEAPERLQLPIRIGLKVSFADVGDANGCMNSQSPLLSEHLIYAAAEFAYVPVGDGEAEDNLG